MSAVQLTGQPTLQSSFFERNKTLVVTSIALIALSLLVASGLCYLFAVGAIVSWSLAGSSAVVFISDLVAIASGNSNSSKTVPINKHEQLTVYPTSSCGGGSCGISALIGEYNPQSGMYEVKEDVKSLRQDFCNWYYDKEELKSSLVDYYSNWNRTTSNGKPIVPKSFTCTLSQADLDKAAELVLNQQQEEFVNFIKPHYLKYLAEPSSMLFQDELIAFAKYSKISLVLYQPSWGNGTRVITSTEEIVEGWPVVAVYYNGSDHYERAFAKPT